MKEFRLYADTPIHSGEIVAEWITEDASFTPFKRHTLIYNGLEGNTVKLILEHTVVKWEGWQWSEVPLFSSVTENKTFLVSPSLPDFMFIDGPVTLKITSTGESGDLLADRISAYE